MLGFNKKAAFRFAVKLDDIHAARIDETARQALIDCDATHAKPEEFADWIEGYLKNGGKVNEVSRHDMRDDFLLARKDACIPLLHGAAAVTMIAPKGVTLTWKGGSGHNDIYLMDGFQTTDSRIGVPRDVSIILGRRGYTEQDMLQGLVATGKMNLALLPLQNVIVYKPLKLVPVRPPGNKAP